MNKQEPAKEIDRIIQESPDLVKFSKFTNYDELGRLLCKNCGNPYSSWTASKLKDMMSDKVGFMIYTCIKCMKSSVFEPKEILEGLRGPTLLDNANYSRENFGIEIYDSAGHLRCVTCGNSHRGFTVKGTHALLDRCDMKILHVACERCGKISSYEKTELRTALPEERVKDLSIGDTLLDWPVLKVMRGGMSTVYLCRSHMGLVAIKTLSPRFSRMPRMEARFWREAETWIRLGEHPNIVTAILLSRDRGRVLIVIEYLEGGSLAELLTKGPLPLQAALLFSKQICQGMEYARSTIPDFAHRDLKPGNCLLADDGTLKVSDFGLTRIQENSLPELLPAQPIKKSGAALTRKLQRGVGTPPYASPEQLEDLASADVRSDVYSFGVMLYEMLTGTPPSLPLGGLSIPANPPRQSIPPKLPRLLSSCLAKRPQDRPTGFGEILDTLQNLGPSYLVAVGHQEQEPQPERQEAVQTDLGSMNLTKPFNLLQVGQTQEALSYSDLIIRSALASDADTASIVAARGYALRAMVLRTMEKYADAAEAADQAIHLFPDDPLALYERGWLYSHFMQFQLAVEALSKSNELDPNRKGLACQLGFAYNAMGKYDRAIGVLEEASRNDPEDHTIFRELGYASLCAANYNHSISHYERALQLCDPENCVERAEMAANLGQAHAKLGDMKLAQEWLNRAWHLAPSGSPIQRQLAEMFQEE